MWKWWRGVHAHGGPANRGGRPGLISLSPQQQSSGFQLSHYVLVHICLAVVGRCKRVQPGYRERMAKHHLHIHPLWLLGPSSLLLLELFDTLQAQDVTNRRRCESQSWCMSEHTAAYLKFKAPAENKRSKGLKIKHVLHPFVCLSEVLIRVRWLTLMSKNSTHTHRHMKMHQQGRVL